MDNSALQAVSPIDGRYHTKCKELSVYFSEEALFRYRVKVEVEYFIALAAMPIPAFKKTSAKQLQDLRNLYLRFTTEDANRIKAIEKITNHDVKAVEYFIKEKLTAPGFKEAKEFVHFALTSQDINNTATPLMIKDSMQEVYLPLMQNLLTKLKELAKSWKDIPMLARTHGQAASPTKLGKEIHVFIERLEQQLKLMKAIPHSAKFGGATGNFNAHLAAYPKINWTKFADSFVNKTLGLQRSKTTTQIEHYDNMAALFDNLKRINTILIDLDRDIWAYISMNYFKQRIKKGEVGSSAMPHKVNPIDFENSEGNLGMANALFEHFAAKLPISRLQRDLTDSTVMRNIGVPMAHTIIAVKSLLGGLEKIYVNEEAIQKDLEANWAVVSEAVQTILKAEGIEGAYEKLKDFARTGGGITKAEMNLFIDSLTVSTALKTRLKKISPHNYTGIC